MISPTTTALRVTRRYRPGTLVLETEFETETGRAAVIDFMPPGDNVDGLPAGEGAFLACSFWLVDNYVLQGRLAEAREIFERLVSRCNDVGLLAEELDPATGRMLGNFPQAYSHVGLINCALNLGRQTGPADSRSDALSPIPGTRGAPATREPSAQK